MKHDYGGKNETILIMKQGILTGNLLDFFFFLSFFQETLKVVQSQFFWICMDLTISCSNSKSELDIVHNMMNSDMRSAKIKGWEVEEAQGEELVTIDTNCTNFFTGET